MPAGRNKDDTRTNQAKADANLKEMKEEMSASQEFLKDEMLAKMESTSKRWMPRQTQIKKNVSRNRCQ
jgi:hypothetical protein